jgi:hypothetical protein
VIMVFSFSAPTDHPAASAGLSRVKGIDVLTKPCSPPLAPSFPPYCLWPTERGGHYAKQETTFPPTEKVRGGGNTPARALCQMTLISYLQLCIFLIECEK